MLLFEVLVITVLLVGGWPVLQGVLEVFQSWRKDFLLAVLVGIFLLGQLRRCLHSLGLGPL